MTADPGEAKMDFMLNPRESAGSIGALGDSSDNLTLLE